MTTSPAGKDLSRATALVLGTGIQGRAVIEDLERRSSLGRIIAADCDAAGANDYVRSIGARRTEVCAVDARDEGALRPLIDRADVVVNMLPVPFEQPVLQSAIDAGVHLVSTNYGHRHRERDADAARAGIIVMPEAGFDPGIDLVIAHEAVDQFDEIESLLSYGAGIPAPECRDANPINYKISWSFEGVLRAYARPARVVIDGRAVEIEGRRIFDAEWVRPVAFDGLGEFEAFVNGDAAEFLELLGIAHSVRTSARYSLRWPGHCAFWRRLAHLGFLDERPIAALGVSPQEFMRHHLEPQLQYQPGERDMIMLRIDVRGRRGGVSGGARWELVDCADRESGLLAMSRVVGYPASIVAQMILDGTITRKGVGCPGRDIPPGPFMTALAARGIEVRKTVPQGEP